MSSSKIIQLSTQESILYFYIKQHGWTSQRDCIAFRGKDDRRTRKLLHAMETRKIIIHKYKPIYNGYNTLDERFYHIV